MAFGYPDLIIFGKMGTLATPDLVILGKMGTLATKIWANWAKMGTQKVANLVHLYDVKSSSVYMRRSATNCGGGGQNGKLMLEGAF